MVGGGGGRGGRQGGITSQMFWYRYATEASETGPTFIILKG